MHLIPALLGRRVSQVIGRVAEGLTTTILVIIVQIVYVHEVFKQLLAVRYLGQVDALILGHGDTCVAGHYSRQIVLQVQVVVFAAH